ncbi:hypothetical protein RRG08_040008 [Elysia crispata]|uniref:Uncharacterized protein n=1 Tax=Elysia crispata TaxID=231223 RepID=A0AAE0Z9K3_9GAST|nr:hypothetical protein RRG08_040008 [Elysia crispata]
MFAQHMSSKRGEHNISHTVLNIDHLSCSRLVPGRKCSVTSVMFAQHMSSKRGEHNISHTVLNIDHLSCSRLVPGREVFSN